MNAKKKVYKEKEFGIYVLWKSLPAHIRGMKKKDLELSGFTDPLILKIIKIKNQTEFAKYFNIKDLGTLTDWNNKIEKENITSPLLESRFQNQSLDINEQIILPSISELKKKIFKQSKVIKLLKKENIELRKKRVQRVAIKSEPTKVIDPIILEEKNVEQKVEIDTTVLNTDQGFFQKIKKLFLK